jgi:O-antigen ligase
MTDARSPAFIRLGLLLCGLLVSLPFLNPYHYFPLLTFYTEWLAFVIGLAALAAIAAVPARNPVPIPALCIGMLLLTALLVLQALLGQVAIPQRSALGALYAIWAVLVVMLGAWLRSELGEVLLARTLQRWLALAGLLAAASGFVQYYHIPLPFGVYSAVQPLNVMFGTVNQPNNFADYLGCALVSVAFLRARDSLAVAPALVVALPVAAAMALSGSRASWGYMAIAFALVGLVRLGGHRDEASRILRLVAIAFAAFVLVQVLNAYTGIFAGPEGRPSSAGERLLLGGSLEIGATGRGPLFLYAWQMFLANPLLGVGFGQYAWHAFDLAADLPGGAPPGIDVHSHNLFLQLLAETGVAGLLCVAVPLALWLARIPWRSLTPERCWMIGVLAIIGLHSLLEYPLWHANFLGVFALLFGAASAGGAALEVTRLRRALVLVVALGGGMTAYGAWSDYRAFERWYLAVEAKTLRGGLPDPGDLERLLRLGENSLLAPQIERMASEAITLDERDIADKLAFNTRVMRAYPIPSVALRQVALLGLSGSDEDARRTLRAAIMVYPDWTRRWLPALEALARTRPERFAGLLEEARTRLGEPRSRAD